jgi:hypothetical protein
MRIPLVYRSRLLAAWHDSPQFDKTTHKRPASTIPSKYVSPYTCTPDIHHPRSCPRSRYVPPGPLRLILNGLRRESYYVYHYFPCPLTCHRPYALETMAHPLRVGSSSSYGMCRASFNPTLAATGAVSHAKQNLYVAAAVGLFGLAPYTRLLMWGTITELSKRGQSGKDEEKDTRELVKKWGTMNFWRGVLLLGSTGIGIWASLV